MMLLVLLAALCTSLLLGWAWHDRPGMDTYSRLFMAPSAARSTGMQVRFFGVSTVLVDDGEARILVDGFVTRPSLASVLFDRIAPDPAAIGEFLARAGIRDLDAVVTVHSHYDHAMDAAEIARITGAILVGSASTANIARGSGLPERQIRLIDPEESIRFGEIALRAVRSSHVPHGQAMGDIATPLSVPARATEYREGGSYSLLLTRRDRTLLVQGSAGFRTDVLAGFRADVVLLGVGLLSRMDEAYRDRYWHEVVTATRARRVIPVHWDDFTEPLYRPLRPFPRIVDDFDGTMRFLASRAAAEGVDLRLLPTWVAVDPFAGL